MRKDTKQLLLIGGGIIVLYMLLQNRREIQPTPSGYTGQPQYGTPGWVMWAQNIITAAGGLANDLFGPGGPFEGKSKADVQAALNTPTGNGVASQEDSYFFYG